jgi:hypothetical protein
MSASYGEPIPIFKGKINGPMKKGVITIRNRYPSLTLLEKQSRVLNALIGGSRLTKKQLANETGMSVQQVVQGWRALRHQPGGNMWVMEPHGKNTLYYVAIQNEAMLNYMMWQASRNIKTADGLIVSTEQLVNNFAKTHPGTRLQSDITHALSGLKFARETYENMLGKLEEEMKDQAKVESEIRIRRAEAEARAEAEKEAESMNPQ